MSVPPTISHFFPSSNTTLKENHHHLLLALLSTMAASQPADPSAPVRGCGFDDEAAGESPEVVMVLPRTLQALWHLQKSLVPAFT